MEKKFKKLWNENKGYALPAAMIMLALLLSAAGYLITQQVSEYERNMKSRDYEICLLIGKNAMEVVKSEIAAGKKEMKVINSADLNGGKYSYEIYQTGQDRFSGKISSQYKAYQNKFTISCELENSGELENFYWDME